MRLTDPSRPSNPPSHGPPHSLMRLGLALSATLFITTLGVGQDVRSLLEPPRAGSQVSFGLPVSIADLRALGLCADSSRYFRQVDLSGAGLGDIVYSGPHIDPRSCAAVGEGAWTIVFRKAADSVVETFRGGGVIRGFTHLSRGVVQLTLLAGPCCDDFEYAWTFVRLEATPRALKQEINDQILTTDMTLQVHPQRWFEAPIPFHVAHEGYKFRYAPAVDDSTEGRLADTGRRGNALAEFHKGAPGVGLAEFRDTDRRVWWLVLIDATSTDSHVLEDRWGSGYAHARWLGWMSSRYLRADSSSHGH